MLLEIVKLLERSAFLSVDDIAKLLHMEKESVIVGLEHLTKMGYIKEMTKQGCCGNSCRGCNACGNNCSRMFGLIYSLSDKSS